MRILLFILALVTMVTLAQQTFAEAGKCLGKGYVERTPERCSVYDNSDQKTCEQADGKAQCLWQAAAPQNERGSGPIRVECTSADGQLLIYNTNRLLFESSNGVLVAIGFGPNRQDDGMAVIEGSCEIKPSAPPIRLP